MKLLLVLCCILCNLSSYSQDRSRNHPTTQDLDSLFILFQQNENYEELLALAEPILQGAEEKDTVYAKALFYSALAYEKFNELEQAKDYCKQAMYIWASKDPGNQYHIKSLKWSAVLSARLGYYEEAEPFFIEYNEWIKKSLGTDHAKYSQSL
ncbi:MAG: hypothetical protein MK212_16055, partial [Saprospiraceae bacterium]|nr:hypothetical protein [Saprospiraceae bacterium]